MDVILAEINKGVIDYIPGYSSLMLKQALNVFENENLRLALFDNPCKLAEKSPSCILKAQFVSNNRESLARSPSYK